MARAFGEALLQLDQLVMEYGHAGSKEMQSSGRCAADSAGHKQIAPFRALLQTTTVFMRVVKMAVPSTWTETPPLADIR